MICPHCSQWNPAGRPRCVFCQNDLALGAPDRTSVSPEELAEYRASAPPAPRPLTSGTQVYEREPGSPKDLAKSLRIASIVTGLVIVSLWMLWQSCMGY